jgi:two-component system sensor histidine kinase BaeS
MKIGITSRLFLSILVATSLANLCIFMIMQWNINRGFMEYLHTLDQSRIERLAERLEQVYVEHGSWDFLREDPRLFYVMAEQSGDFAASEGPKELNQGTDAPPFPPPGPHRPRPPFIVVDADRNPLVGNPAGAEGSNFRPIVHGGKTIGYIGIMSPKRFLSPPQLGFLKKQKLALVLAALGMVLVVAIFSIPLARRLVRPIKIMAAATHDLASGRYSVRIPVASSDELGLLARNFNEMALTLEKNEKARRQWVADISHELRTPLSVLRGEIEALLEGIRKITPDAIHSLHAEVLRLNHLVDDLYQLALSDLGALTYRKEDIDLAEVLKDSIESYGAELVRKDITLTKDISPGSKIVFADAERLHQLFSNLLDNSLKYTDAGGKLVIRLTCSDAQAMVDFEDSAPEVPEGDLDKVFDHLYRVEGSRSRVSGGAGLGLAICRNIVEAHAGTISAHPSPLGGILIRVSIPVVGDCS